MVAPWLGAALRGAGVGVATLAAFFVAHAILVQPIWDRLDALARGLVLATTSGALLGLCYHRLRGERAFAGVRGGVLLGGLAGATLLPFAVAGAARAAGSAWWPALLAVLIAALVAAALVLQREGRSWLRRAELPTALLLANAFPALFLTLIADFHDQPIDHATFPATLAGIYVASGALLGHALRARR